MNRSNRLRDGAAASIDARSRRLTTLYLAFALAGAGLVGTTAHAQDTPAQAPPSPTQVDRTDGIPSQGTATAPLPATPPVQMPAAAATEAPVPETQAAPAGMPVSAGPASVGPPKGPTTPTGPTEPTSGSTSEAGSALEGQVPRSESSDGTLQASITQGVHLSSPNHGFELQAHIATWTRLVLDVPPSAGASDYFEVPLVRPMLQASLLDGTLQLLAQPELAGGSPKLLDLTLDLVAAPEFRVRIGQFRTPYSRAFITPIVQLSMPDRGLVSDNFRANRDTGLMVSGNIAEHLEYDLGVFNGAGINGRTGDTATPMGIARVVVTAYGAVPYDQAPSLTQAHPHGLALGLSTLFRESERDEPVASTGATTKVTDQTLGGGAEVSFVEGPVAVFGEGFYHSTKSDPGTSLQTAGAFAQVGVFLMPQVLELSARGGWIAPNVNAGSDLVQSYEGAIKGHMAWAGQHYGHHLCLGLQYKSVVAPDSYGTFLVGTTHRVTAQLQLWI